MRYKEAILYELYICGKFSSVQKILEASSWHGFRNPYLEGYLEAGYQVGYLEKDTFQETFSLSLEGIFLKRDVLKVISKKTFVKKAL